MNINPYRLTGQIALAAGILSLVLMMIIGGNPSVPLAVVLAFKVFAWLCLGVAAVAYLMFYQRRRAGV